MTAVAGIALSVVLAACTSSGTHRPDLGVYTLTPSGAAGSTYATVGEPSASVNIVLRVINQNLGKHYAITECQSGC